MHVYGHKVGTSRDGKKNRIYRQQRLLGKERIYVNALWKYQSHPQGGATNAAASVCVCVGEGGGSSSLKTSDWSDLLQVKVSGGLLP